MNPYWIKTEGVRLAIIPRPRGQDWLPDDISLLQRAGIDVVVSALTAAENEELGLVEESRCCQTRGIEFLSFPKPNVIRRLRAVERYWWAEPDSDEEL